MTASAPDINHRRQESWRRLWARLLAPLPEEAEPNSPKKKADVPASAQEMRDAATLAPS